MNKIEAINELQSLQHLDEHIVGASLCVLGRGMPVERAM